MSSVSGVIIISPPQDEDADERRDRELGVHVEPVPREAARSRCDANGSAGTPGPKARKFGQSRRCSATTTRPPGPSTRRSSVKSAQRASCGAQFVRRRAAAARRRSIAVGQRQLAEVRPARRRPAAELAGEHGARGRSTARVISLGVEDVEHPARCASGSSARSAGVDSSSPAWMLIHDAGRKPSAARIQSHRISGDRS